MTSDQPQVLVSVDQDGNYYLLPRETMDQARVP